MSHCGRIEVFVSVLGHVDCIVYVQGRCTLVSDVSSPQYMQVLFSVYSSRCLLFSSFSIYSWSV